MRWSWHLSRASCCCCCCWVTSVMSDSVRPHRRQPTRLRRPWDSPGKNTGVGCHFLLQCMKVKSESEVAQLCLTLSDPMDCSLPGSSVHVIFQARVLEWVPLPSPWELVTCQELHVLIYFPPKQKIRKWPVKLLNFVFKYNVKNKDASLWHLDHSTHKHIWNSERLKAGHSPVFQGRLGGCWSPAVNSRHPEGCIGTVWLHYWKTKNN